MKSAADLLMDQNDGDPLGDDSELPVEGNKTFKRINFSHSYNTYQELQSSNLRHLPGLASSEWEIPRFKMNPLR